MTAPRPDEHWMRLALREARRGTGLTSPNPAVGAVVVRDGTVLGKGWHRRAGAPHAEIEALRDAERRGQSDAVRGAALYITLEPCCTTGRTPPCTEAIVAAGLSRVVWAMDDPNPQHAGRARALLEQAGIATRSGVLETEAREVNAPFIRWIMTGLPWVIAKAGMSLDGRITRPDGEGQWITSEAARADAMSLRVRADAIMIGAETVRQDDPSLTLRGRGIPRGKAQPWRVVMTRSGDIPAGAKLLTDAHRERTLVFKETPLREVLRDLGARGATCVLIEGGGQLLAQAFAEDLVDEAVFYTAPLISGSGRPVVAADAFSGPSRPFRFAGMEAVGPDVKLRALRLADAPQE